MLAKTLSCGLSGVYGYPVEVEAFISNGMIGFEIVGLPSMAVKESRDRVRAAIAVSGLSFPFGKVTVNLAPADVKKEGTTFGTGHRGCSAGCALSGGVSWAGRDHAAGRAGAGRGG